MTTRTLTLSGTIDVAVSGKIDPIADIAAGVVANDDRLRHRVQKLVDALLRDAEYTVKFGTPSERAQLTKMIVPALLKSLQSADYDARGKAQEEAYARMLAGMRGGAGVADDT